MAQVLHLDSSPRGDRSISRALTKTFVSTWKEAHPEDKIVYRDLGHYPVPHVDEGWIAASFTPPEYLTLDLSANIQDSDALIDEVLAADYYVLGVPMYNFSIPSTLKAYIDQIVRVNRTFSVGEQGYEGLVKHKKMVVVSARGGSYPAGTPMGQYDFQEPYLRSIFGMIGITDITFIHAENLNMGEEARQQSVTTAQAAIQRTIASW
ncbi:MAG: FMN-dependent NADH-azoreductase [Leptolyngbyaceae cyanobacterium SM1_3_5]|nr:FMN-dependent NADH-azoreductase [Leptolyngbyaceae cyanobacterium SM1_3_5]